MTVLLGKLLIFKQENETRLEFAKTLPSIAGSITKTQIPENNITNAHTNEKIALVTLYKGIIYTFTLLPRVTVGTSHYK